MKESSSLQALRGQALHQTSTRLEQLETLLAGKDNTIKQLETQLRIHRVKEQSQHSALQSECERLRTELSQVPGALFEYAANVGFSYVVNLSWKLYSKPRGEKSTISRQTPSNLFYQAKPSLTAPTTDWRMRKHAMQSCPPGISCQPTYIFPF